MGYARSTYGSDGALHTETEAPDNGAVNLQRELVNDRRSDYKERRTNRGSERPIGSAPPPLVRVPMADMGVGTGMMGTGRSGNPILDQAQNAAARASIIQNDSMSHAAPLKLAPPDMTGLGGMGYTMDPYSMNAYQRQAFMPQNSQGGSLGIQPTDDGWLQYLALTQKRQQTDRTGNNPSQSMAA